MYDKELYGSPSAGYVNNFFKCGPTGRRDADHCQVCIAWRTNPGLWTGPSAVDSKGQRDTMDAGNSIVPVIHHFYVQSQQQDQLFF